MRPVPPWVRLIRWFLAVVYIIYGAVKLAGGQFWHGAFTIDSRTIDGPFFAWAFFGWSKPYAIFAGLAELVPFGKLGRVLLAVLGLPFLFLATTVLTESLSTGPEKAVLERLVAQGVARDSLELVRSRYDGQLVDRKGFVEYRSSDPSRLFRAEVRRPISYVAWRVGVIEETRP